LGGGNSPVLAIACVWSGSDITFRKVGMSALVRQVGPARPSGNRTLVQPLPPDLVRLPARVGLPGLPQPARLERFHTGRTQKPQLLRSISRLGDASEMRAQMERCFAPLIWFAPSGALAAGAGRWKFSRKSLRNSDFLRHLRFGTRIAGTMSGRRAGRSIRTAWRQRWPISCGFKAAHAPETRCRS
jgi:hypothetical protein